MSPKRHPTAFIAILLTSTAMSVTSVAAQERAHGSASTAMDRGHGAAPGVVQVAQSRSVMSIQTRLNRLGYEAGPEDGLMGARTRGAIEAYQEDEGLLVTGEPSQSLLDHINDSVEDRFGSLEPPEDDEDDQAEPDSEEDMIAGIQSELRQRDYGIPAVSGELDEATRDAIREYERDRGYLVTGRATTELLEDLRARGDDEDDAADVGSGDVANVQAALNARGYDAGPADGVLGPRTRTAIRTYQSDAGMDPSGRISADLLARLESDFPDEAPEEDEPEPDEQPEFVTLLSDSFDDGDYTSDPRWRVSTGSFSVRSGGLTSRMEGPRPDTLEGAGLELLGTVLERELGIRLPTQGGVAAAHTEVAIPDTFRISADITGRDFTRGQVNIGPYRGGELGHGYRLAYLADSSEPLTLLRIGRGDQVALDSAAVNFSNDQQVTLDWERQPDGTMTVAADGDVVLSARDTNLSGGFDGFSILNAGGEWTLNSVRVEGQE